jgi:hypothetical protein
VYVRPFVFAVPDRPPLALSDEVREAFWIPLAELLAPGVWRDLDIPGVERPMPAYVVRDLVIWGMTERILTPMLQTVVGQL